MRRRCAAQRPRRGGKGPVSRPARRRFGRSAARLDGRAADGGCVEQEAHPLAEAVRLLHRLQLQKHVHLRSQGRSQTVASGSRRGPGGRFGGLLCRSDLQADRAASRENTIGITLTSYKGTSSLFWSFTISLWLAGHVSGGDLWHRVPRNSLHGVCLATMQSNPAV